MKVHELVEQYKQIADNMRQDHEKQLWQHNRLTAYLQSRDPMSEVGPPLWDDFLEWDNKQRGKL
jgi:hypothetical protein